MPSVTLNIPQFFNTVKYLFGIMKGGENLLKEQSLEVLVSLAQAATSARLRLLSPQVSNCPSIHKTNHPNNN